MFCCVVGYKRGEVKVWLSNTKIIMPKMQNVCWVFWGISVGVPNRANPESDK